MFGNGRIDFPEIAGGNTHELGKAAVLINTDNLEVLADVRLSQAALAAVSAV